MKKILILPYLIDPTLAELDYLSEGILEELIELLSSVNTFKVSSRTTSLYLKSNPLPVQKVKDEYDIDYLIEGRIKKVGNDLNYQVITRVVETADETTVLTFKDEFNISTWSKCLLKTSQEVLSKIGGKTNTSHLSANQSEGRELYLKGIYHWNRYTYQEIKLAIACFNSAIMKDGNYAPACAALADCFSVIAVMGYEDPIENFKKAKKAVQHALSANDKHSESYVSSAMIEIFHERNLLQAKANLDKAMSLNPNNLKLRHTYAMYYVFIGRLDEAIKHSMYTIKNDPLSIPHYAMIARIHAYKKEFEIALDYTNAALTIDSGSVEVRELRGYIYLIKGNLEAAIEDLSYCVKIGGGPLSYAYLCYAYSLAKFYEESKSVELKLDDKFGAQNTGMYDFSKSLIYLGRNQYDQFYVWFNKAVNRGLSLMLGDLHCNPIYNKVKKDNRFQELMAVNKIDLAKEKTKRRPKSVLVLESRTKEKLQVDPQDILYVQSEDNYCNVFYYLEGVLEKVLLRITLSEVADQLAQVPGILRCHKSFLVQIGSDMRMMGNSKAYFIESPYLPIKIPVSRSKAVVIKEKYFNY